MQRRPARIRPNARQPRTFRRRRTATSRDYHPLDPEASLPPCFQALRRGPLLRCGAADRCPHHELPGAYECARPRHPVGRGLRGASGCRRRGVPCAQPHQGPALLHPVLQVRHARAHLGPVPRPLCGLSVLSGHVACRVLPVLRGGVRAVLHGRHLVGAPEQPGVRAFLRRRAFLPHGLLRCARVRHAPGAALVELRRAVGGVRRVLLRLRVEHGLRVRAQAQTGGG